MGQPAVAITDHGVLYGAVDFYSPPRAPRRSTRSSAARCTWRRAHGTIVRAARTAIPNHLILLARNDVGYRNLIKLVSTAHLEGHYYKPRIDRELLAEHAEGLICLSACLGGELPQAILRGDLRRCRVDRASARRDLRAGQLLPRAAGPRHPRGGDGARRVSSRSPGAPGLPLVATNDSHYIKPEDAEAHDILLCLQTGARREDEKRFRFSGPEYYLASTRRCANASPRMARRSSNTVAIAERCHVEIPLGRNLLPTYSPIPDGLDADTYLRELCEAGVRERYGDAVNDEVRERLEHGARRHPRDRVLGVLPHRVGSHQGGALRRGPGRAGQRQRGRVRW